MSRKNSIEEGLKGDLWTDPNSPQMWLKVSLFVEAGIIERKKIDKFHTFREGRAEKTEKKKARNN